MDNFREESISKASTGLNTGIYVLSFAGMIIFGFVSLMFFMSVINGNFSIPAIVVTLVFGGLAYGCFVAKNNQRIEYDYTFTNGILDIAKVINNSKRKRLLSTNVREFEIIFSAMSTISVLSSPIRGLNTGIVTESSVAANPSRV